MPTANFRKTAPGDERGNPELACQPSRSTVAFELLRWRRPIGRLCSQSKRGHQEQQDLRQQRRRNGRLLSTDAAQLPRPSGRFYSSCTATYHLDRLQHFHQGVHLGCPRPTALGHERPAAPQLTTAFSQRLMFSPQFECVAATSSSVPLIDSIPMNLVLLVFNLFCGGSEVPDNLHG